MTLFPDRKSFLLVTGVISIHDAKTGETIVSFNSKSGNVRTGVVSPDGSFVLIGCGNYRMLTKHEPGHVEVWKADGTYVTRFRAHDSPVESLAISPDGRKLATGDNFGSAKVWDISSLLMKHEK
jgi:WD40 repeat protein